MATSPADCDLAVLGAGPAGLAAAVAAAAGGARVALVDAGARVGGQFWRHREGDDGAVHHDWPTLVRLRSGLSRVDVRTRHSVWHVERTEAGFTVHTDRGALTCRALVIATGAYDRQLPFPGWTLPGVYTAGGAQALLKGQGVRAGNRVVVGGTGPFLLPVAAGLADAGAEVAGVFEAGSPAGFARSPLAVLANAGKLAEGAGYLKTLLRQRVPYRTRTAVVAAHGTDGVEGVTVASLDRQWRIVPGSAREIACDTVAVGYGFTPQLELPLQLGCETTLGADGGLVAVADDRQRATVPGVYLAGEVCGVGGSALSVVEGELAGLHAALTTVGAEPSRDTVARLLRQRKSLRAFADAMHAAHPVRPGWQTWLDADTQVCRCEEVSAGTIRDAVKDLGATDARTVKLLARPGMGLCQGRVCGYATACLVAAEHGREPAAADLSGVAARPIAQPVKLGDLARG
ncbi:FAD/NAD(P)-binding oxidoreductase [Amycolatopsis rhabdoformis]|uniref:FAD/NAD(P)-binding oxidoreductase n=1 Tax=Amycolatopsis rhabdoformis TaxID=1448059 RepID=A0ABZ1IAH9_9PSEU|nr:FAD/NAD(P)-binding oxidoreductase [Amycolatopsis rhabdoformis]WSE31471.1 FAD/NAD(P)-binding oxidoreductase [Amycolatopsis rhabdoformis]